jgi:hypothetical protein
VCIDSFSESTARERQLHLLLPFSGQPTLDALPSSHSRPTSTALPPWPRRPSPGSRDLGTGTGPGAGEWSRDNRPPVWRRTLTFFLLILLRRPPPHSDLGPPVARTRRPSSPTHPLPAGDCHPTPRPRASPGAQGIPHPRLTNENRGTGLHSPLFNISPLTKIIDFGLDTMAFQIRTTWKPFLGHISPGGPMVHAVA